MVLGPRLVSTASLTQQRHLGSQILLFCYAGTANWDWSLCGVSVWWGFFCAAGRGATSLWALASTDCGAMSKPMVGGGLRECSLSYRLWQGEDSQPEKALSLPLDGLVYTFQETCHRAPRLQSRQYVQAPKLRRMRCP